MSGLAAAFGCFLLNLAGAATMLVFGRALGAHARFLGYEGDMDAAARACARAAWLFGALAGLALLGVVAAALRQKRGGVAAPPRAAGYVAV